MSNPITNSIVAESTGWDECGDYGDIQLYNAKLAVDLSPSFKKGDVVETIVFMFSESKIEIYESCHEKTRFGQTPNRIVGTFDIKLSIV